jgi:hypothetical protein
MRNGLLGGNRLPRQPIEALLHRNLLRTLGLQFCGLDGCAKLGSLWKSGPCHKGLEAAARLP